MKKEESKIDSSLVRKSFQENQQIKEEVLLEDVVSDIPKKLVSNASIKEEIQEPDSPIKEDSLYILIGGEQAF